MDIDIERLKVDKSLWPEGAMWAVISKSKKVRFYGNVDESIEDSCIPRPPKKAQEAEWDGSGLPPVGVECELLRGKEWVPVEITGKGKRVTVFRRLCNAGLEEITEADATEFRTIRTKQQRQREELKAFLSESVCSSNGMNKHQIMGDLTDAILSKYNLTEK